MMGDVSTATCSLEHVASTSKFFFTSKSRHRHLVKQSQQIPRPTNARLKESLSDCAVDITQVRNGAPEKTYLYLAYGSNMCALTFLDRRGIKPIAQLNVVVPAVQLTFDLPGVPYSEPCFGNVRYRDVSQDKSTSQEKEAGTQDYHKDRWHKGLVGVVYEVTAADYAHIIATEGGGAGYGDVLVDCYALSPDPNELVPLHPTGTPLKAHTLFAPVQGARPDPSYAQASARYLKLLTDGAEEHNLPHEYKDFLYSLRPYATTTSAQELGRWLFILVWGPIFALFIGGAGRIFLRPDGTYPPWFAKMVAALFVGVWASYDNFFKPLFGDGERSITNGGALPGKAKSGKNVEHDSAWNEKTPLLRCAGKNQEWNEPGTSGGDEMV